MTELDTAPPRAGSSVIFLHELDGDATSFAAQQELARDHTLIPWVAPAGDSIDEAADSVVTQLRAAGARSTHVVGVSWGAAVAATVAVRHPDLVRSLVLVGSWSHESGPTDVFRAETHPTGFTEDADVIAATEVAPELADITAPTLVLCGADETAAVWRGSQATAGSIADAVFVTINDASRRPHRENAEHFNAWVHSFLAIADGFHIFEEAGA